MNVIWRAGILLGVLCGLWIFVMGFTGWYRDPVLANVFFLVIAIEAVVLLWGLRRLAAPGRSYWHLVRSGVLMACIGGVIVALFSIAFTTIAFPDYFAELREIQHGMLEQKGYTIEQIEQAEAMSAWMSTPLVNALVGMFMTIATGFIESLVIAAFVRGRARRHENARA